MIQSVQLPPGYPPSALRDPVSPPSPTSTPRPVPVPSSSSHAMPPPHSKPAESTQSQTPSSLSPLPPELLQLILTSHLITYPTLASCARVNSVFYASAIRALYQTLSLDRDWSKFEDDGWGDENEEEEDDNLENDDTVKVRITSQPFQILSGSNQSRREAMAAAVHTLVINPHHPETCGGACDSISFDTKLSKPPHVSHIVQLPPLPNLVTLVLCLRSLHGPMNYHLPPLSATSPSNTCPLLSQLQPDTLVIRGAPLLYDGIAKRIPLPPIWLAPSPSKTLTRFVALLKPDIALVGSNLKTESPGCGARGLWSSIPASAVDITLVFWTEFKGREWRPRPRPGWISLAVLELEDLELEDEHKEEINHQAAVAGAKRFTRPPWAGSWVGRFCSDLAEVIVPWLAVVPVFTSDSNTNSRTNRRLTRSVTIVNAGGIDRFAVGCNLNTGSNGRTMVEISSSSSSTRPMTVEEIVQSHIEEYFDLLLKSAVSRWYRTNGHLFNQKGQEEATKSWRNAIRFVDMRTWVREGNWRGVITEEEAAPWLGGRT